jgi:cell envelope-related function transcriptional attenuator common domain
VLLIAWPAYLIHYGNSKLHNVDALSDKADTPGSTYLIVGSDKREKGAIDDPTEGQRSDTIMLLHVPESGKPALVSLPRDAYVKIPDNGSGKFNSAYSIGGPKLLVRTVEELSSLKVDHYVEVSMGGVQSLVEAVGGVNLCYDADVNDRDSGMVWEKGCHDADGPTALAFSRMRKADPLGDIGRALRQRQVVSKVVSKAASPSTFVNPMRQRALVGTVAEHLTVDPDTGMIALGRAGLSIRNVMGPDGLMGAPPISDMNYRVNRQSAVRLDPNKIDGFFEKLRQGSLTTADFYSPVGSAPVG